VLILKGLFFPVIETARLVLKPLTIDELDSLLEIFSDHEVMRYWNTAPWAALADPVQRIAMVRRCP
jgi:RimJ/RimL family protein N-acetyltransferase